MSTKRTGVSCYDKAAPDEPLFVLRAQDFTAPYIVREWAISAKEYGVAQDKIDEALKCATEMENWKHRKMPD